MDDLQNDPVTPPRLGRNQRIAVLGGGAFGLLGFALVLGGYVAGEKWLSTMAVFVPLWLSICLGPSAFLKSRFGANGGP